MFTSDLSDIWASILSLNFTNPPSTTPGGACQRSVAALGTVYVTNEEVSDPNTTHSLCSLWLTDNNSYSTDLPSSTCQTIHEYVLPGKHYNNDMLVTCKQVNIPVAQVRLSTIINRVKMIMIPFKIIYCLQCRHVIGQLD